MTIGLLSLTRRQTQRAHGFCSNTPTSIIRSAYSVVKTDCSPPALNLDFYHNSQYPRTQLRTSATLQGCLLWTASAAKMSFLFGGDGWTWQHPIGLCSLAVANIASSICPRDKDEEWRMAAATRSLRHLHKSRTRHDDLQGSRHVHPLEERDLGNHVAIECAELVLNEDLPDSDAETFGIGQRLPTHGEGWGTNKTSVESCFLITDLARALIKPQRSRQDSGETSIRKRRHAPSYGTSELPASSLPGSTLPTKADETGSDNIWPQCSIDRTPTQIANISAIARGLPADTPAGPRAYRTRITSIATQFRNELQGSAQKTLPDDSQPQETKQDRNKDESSRFDLNRKLSGGLPDRALFGSQTRDVEALPMRARRAACSTLAQQTSPAAPVQDKTAKEQLGKKMMVQLKKAAALSKQQKIGASLESLPSTHASVDATSGKDPLPESGRRDPPFDPGQQTHRVTAHERASVPERQVVSVKVRSPPAGTSLPLLPAPQSTGLETSIHACTDGRPEEETKADFLDSTQAVDHTIAVTQSPKLSNPKKGKIFDTSSPSEAGRKP